VDFTIGLAVQLLILTTGIYVVLGFLRTTRGGGLVRGLALTMVVGFVGLWGLSKVLVLEELDHIIQTVSGYVAVILVILFQPELRRGMVHLGENRLLGRLLKARRQEILTEVSQAMIQMAKKRQGALVAFERKIALDAFIEGGVKIDAEVNRILLDSIFHHGGPLHDGAVVLRGERIAAATCLFPLTENIEISKSTGTRHRAALGLTEETDAVTVAVSEETGFISICKGGKMERNIPSTKLEEVLRDRIGSDEDAGAAVLKEDVSEIGVRGWLRRLCTENAGRKAGAFTLAVVLYWFAHQDISLTKSFQLRVVEGLEGTTPVAGQMQIVLPPGRNYHRVEPQDEAILEVEVEGTRAQLDELIGGFGGVLVTNADIEPGAHEFPLGEVMWSVGGIGQGLDIRWKSAVPRFEVAVQFQRERYTLDSGSVVVDTTKLSPRYRAQTDGVFIDPASVEIEGPIGMIDRLGTEDLPLLLSPITLLGTDVTDRVEYLGLDQSLQDKGFSLVGSGTVEVRLEILPAEHFLPVPIEKEIALVWRSLDRPDETARWKRPTQRARFTIRTVGIFQSEPNSEVWIGQDIKIRRFIEDNLWVFVDASNVVPGGGSQVKVRWEVKEDWRDVFGEEMGALDERAEIVPVLESDPRILLIEEKPADSGAGNDGPNDGSGGN